MNKIIYLDAAATSLKPESVIEAESDFLRNRYANAGRGICARAAGVDEMVAKSRERVAGFINADARQIVWTGGATDALNRVRHILGAIHKKPIVAVSDLDHHSARLPWMAAADAGLAEIRVMKLDSDFNIDAASVPYADIMVLSAMSNVLGVAQNVEGIVRAARAKNPGVIVIVDAAQYAAHLPIDVRRWDCDFLAFSGHKIGADTGLGVMYVKDPDGFQPDRFGGGMVARVGEHDITFNPAPEKFEAGTLPLTQIAGVGPAIDYLQVHLVNLDLIKYMYDRLQKMPRVKILSPRDASLISFVIDGMHVLDFGALVGARGVCLRVGNMCATWICRALGIAGSARISVGPWNTMDDMRAAADIIEGVLK